MVLIFTLFSDRMKAYILRRFCSLVFFLLCANKMLESVLGLQLLKCTYLVVCLIILYIEKMSICIFIAL